MVRRGIASLGLAAALVLSACSSDPGAESGELGEDLAVNAEEPGVSASEEPAADPEPEGEVEGGVEPTQGENAQEEGPDPSDIDITTVPDDITVEYVQAVVDELERILAEALVLMMEEGELTIEITDRVGEIFSLDQVNARTASLQELSDSGFPNMRPPDEIRPRLRRVEQILDISDGCIYAETLTFDDAFLVEPSDPIPVFVRLESPDVARPVDINPTPWVLGSLGVGEPDQLREVRPC